MGYENFSKAPQAEQAVNATILPFDYAARIGRDLDHENERDFSHRDALTGLLNRNGFNAAFQEEMKASNTCGGTVMLIDLENIDMINEKYGRLTGDACITLLGDVIDNITGAYDIKARVEGNKFIVAFTDIDNEIGEFKAARMTRTLNGLYLRIDDHKLNLNITTIAAPYTKASDSKNKNAPDLLGSVNVLRDRKNNTTRAIPSFLG